MEKIEKTLKPEILKTVAEVKPTVTLHSYYLEEKSGGYQLHKVTIQDDIVVSDENVEDPDGWPEVLGYLEVEFAKKHFSE